MTQFYETNCMRCGKPQTASFKDVLCADCRKYLCDPDTATFEAFFRLTKELYKSMILEDGNAKGIAKFLESFVSPRREAQESSLDTHGERK